ncbi:hypothetical protein Fmac_023351 [Flemingia macrophylla]|uniref:Uncharacterized protein n=1 Tax=Flemingia macrophylla TaxID=520843 RepID=A0ABD1LLE9_9FABA
MNTFGSECSSGCESGWTLYLDHSFLNQNASSHKSATQEEHKDKSFKHEDYVGEDLDLSMLSDASSGPPHFPHYEDLNACFYSPSKAKTATKKQKIKENQHLPSFLLDTASSTVFDFSTNNATGGNQQTSTGSVLDYSQGFSTNYFEGGSSFQEQHFGFLQSENEPQGNHRWYGGKGMGMR